MLIDVLELVGGFVLLVVGGEWLVRGAVALSKALGISTLLVSLTVVAFGTSAPELAVNLFAAINGNSGINFGNIIGSNIANVGLILGLTALVSPVIVHRSVILREIPIMLLATAITLGLAFGWLPGVTEPDQFIQSDGVILLVIFLLFLGYNFLVAMRQRQRDPLAEDVEAVHKPHRISLFMATVMSVGGLVCVASGGRLVELGAVSLAQTLGVPQEIIGLTIVAVGSSLPELVTCLIAVRHGHTDIAIGNIVGSNIWNLLLILGVSVTIGPFELPTGGATDLLVMAALSLVLLPLTITQKRVGRGEGAGLLLIYIGYIAMRAVTGI